MDSIAYGVAKSQTWLSDFHFHDMPQSVEESKMQYLEAISKRRE